jgi:hypothetical protein
MAGRFDGCQTDNDKLQVGSDAIFTLDIRDFGVHRLSRNRRIRIVPD